MGDSPWWDDNQKRPWWRHFSQHANEATFAAESEQRVIRIVEELKDYLDGPCKKPLSLRLDARDAFALLLEILEGRRDAEHLEETEEALADMEFAKWQAMHRLEKDPEGVRHALDAFGIKPPLDGRSHVSDTKLRSRYLDLTRDHDPCQAIEALAREYGFPSAEAVHARLVRIQRRDGPLRCLGGERVVMARDPDLGTLVEVQRVEFPPRTVPVPSLTRLRRTMSR